MPASHTAADANQKVASVEDNAWASTAPTTPYVNTARAMAGTMGTFQRWYNTRTTW